MSLSVIPALVYTEALGQGNSFYTSPEANAYNSQTLNLLSARTSSTETGPIGGRDEIMTEDAALVADISPITDAEAEKIITASERDISIYTVHEGDSIGEVADMFGISANTIRWANNIDVKGSIKPGQELIILPISGIKHKVGKGETFASIAKKYNADAREISLFNGIEEEEALVAGTEIIIPQGELAEAPAPAKKKPAAKGTPSKEVPSGYYIRPTAGIRTQGPHGGYRGIDVGAKVGTPVWAMADGTAIIVKSTSAWNGGYGGMIVLSHANGTQTLYAHLSRIDIKQGQKVTQGQVIGAVGNTGRSTGPHLHFEIRGATAAAAKLY